MNSWSKVEPVLHQAHELLMARFPRYLGSDPLGQFDVANADKAEFITVSDILGSFDAWADKLSVNLEYDPLGTAVHELLHANAYSDDWFAPSAEWPEYIVSFRGLEVQVITADRRTVKEIAHRAINEAVTEMFTGHAYEDALPAYEALVPLAQELESALGSELLAHQYFCEGYQGLEEVCVDSGFDLKCLDSLADTALTEELGRNSAS